MKQREIEQLLPGVFQRTAVPGSPLDALLGVMEGMHAPSEAVLAQLADMKALALHTSCRTSWLTVRPARLSAMCTGIIGCSCSMGTPNISM